MLWEHIIRTACTSFCNAKLEFNIAEYYTSPSPPPASYTVYLIFLQARRSVSCPFTMYISLALETLGNSCRLIVQI